MSRERAVQYFNQMHSADQIVSEAIKAMKEAEIDPSFSILSMLNYGVVKLSREISLKEELPYLIFMENYLADTREKLGMRPDDLFSEARFSPAE